MAITDLIANNMTFDPIGSYMKGYGASQVIQSNKRAGQIQEQEAAIQQQKIAIAEKEDMRARGQEFVLSISPVIEKINSLGTPEEKQAAYSQAIPVLSKQAQDLGLPADKLPPQWDQNQADMILGASKRLTKSKGGGGDEWGKFSQSTPGGVFQGSEQGDTRIVPWPGGTTADLKITQIAGEENIRTREAEKKKLSEQYITEAGEGLRASEAYASLKHASDLIKTVETSGLNQAILKAKQYFGIDAANETDLYNKLGVSIAQQLRPTFGAQFTKAEGDWMQSFSASFGKSSESNKRLIEQGLKLSKLRADRGRKAASNLDDGSFYIESIDSALNLSFGKENSKQKTTNSSFMNDLDKELGIK